MKITRKELSGIAFNSDNFNLGDVFTITRHEIFVVIDAWGETNVKVLSLLDKKAYLFNADQDEIYFKVKEISYSI